MPACVERAHRKPHGADAVHDDAVGATADAQNEARRRAVAKEQHAHDDARHERHSHENGCGASASTGTAVSQGAPEEVRCRAERLTGIPPARRYRAVLCFATSTFLG